ncbi:MAG: PP2C family protein-serine/threonine phosphatase [Candidatus Sulfotelmatobacter sp.]
MSVRLAGLIKRFPWLRQVLQIEQVLVFVGVVVYAVLVSLNQRVSLRVILLACLTVGNCVFPLAFLIRRAYVPRRFPWNWVVFVPVQIGFGIVCAVGSVLLLQLTKIDPEPFWVVYGRMGNLTIIVVVVVSGTMYLAEQVQQKLRERNQQLEQTVEKGTIALQQQEEELKRAREIQQMLLPNQLPQLEGAQIAGAWQPAREVGGDYFDVIALDEKRVGVCMGDVAGKGITAALLMANLQASVRAFATADATPREVCTKLNKFLCANIVSGKFVTFFYAIFDAESRTLVYENAGHNPGLLLRANRPVEWLRGDGAVLGVIADWSYQDFTVQLQPGDKLLLSTDGITEAESPQLEEFGEQRLLDAAKGDGASALDTQRTIMQRVTAFCGGNFRDDATLLVLKVV